MRIAFPLIQQRVFHNGAASAILPSPLHVSHFSRKCNPYFPSSHLKTKHWDSILKCRMQMTQTTSHTHLVEVMDVLDRDLLLYHFQCNRDKTQRVYKSIMSHDRIEWQKMKTLESLLGGRRGCSLKDADSNCGLP